MEIYCTVYGSESLLSYILGFMGIEPTDQIIITVPGILPLKLI